MERTLSIIKPDATSRNITGKVNAMIEEAGLRGFAVGQAQVSEKHCGFVINRGGASSAEVLALCREVQRRVRERFGVELELEVRQLNDSEARR